mgnify:CR=1 FL=1
MKNLKLHHKKENKKKQGTTVSPKKSKKDHDLLSQFIKTNEKNLV